MPISLGAVAGGPERLTSIEVCRELMSMFKSEREENSKPFLNVVFHFYGKLMHPKYEGLRTGRFSSKEQGFMIQVAVPESISYSESKLEISKFILFSVKEAIELSRPRWEKHAIVFPFEVAYKNIEVVNSRANEIFNT
jgi:hypothetical protein